MKKSYLLTTAAAALLVAASAASAQTMKKDEAPAHAPAAQQNAPAEKMAPAMKPGSNAAVDKKPHETVGQAPKMQERAPDAKASEDLKSGVHTGKDMTPEHQKSTESQNSTDTKAKVNESAKDSHQTTGQGAAAGHAKLSTEQRTKITTVFKQHNVAPTHLNVSIHVGARVPSSVHFYPMPVEVVTIYPEWRGYDYIRVGNEILVIDPGTREIVAVLDV